MKAWVERFSFIPLLTVILFLGIFVFQHRQDYVSRYDGKYWWNRYENSQYTQGEHSNYILSDSEYNAVKADRLVQFGSDPTSFPAGHPPLSNYFIGVSIFLFHNQNVLSLFAGIACIWFFYLIAKQLLKSSFWSWLLTIPFVSEPLFLTQLNDSMLDIFQLLFALMGIYFYGKWMTYPLQGQSLKWIILSQLSLGLMLSTKFYLGNLPLVMALYFATVLSGNFKLFKIHTISLIFVFFGFALGNLTYFLYHPSLITFLQYQRYVLSWWAGSPHVPPYQAWDLIFNNRWHTWWDSMAIVSVPEWRITWPVIVVFSLLSLPTLLIRHSKLVIPVVALYLWVLGSFFLFSFSAVYPRHLLFIFPALFLLTATTIQSLQGQTLK